MASEFHQRQIAMLRRTPIKDFFSHIAYNHSTQIYQLDDNKVGFAFEIQPMIYAGDEVGNRLNTILSKPSLPDGCIVSFALWAGQDITHISAAARTVRYERFRSTGNHDVDEILQSLSNQHMSFLNEGTRSPVESVYRSRVRDIRGFVSVVIQERKKGRRKKSRSLGEDDKYRELVSEFFEGLSSVDLAPKPLRPVTLKKLLSSIINWQSNANWRSADDYYDDNTPIREQVVDMDTELRVVDGRVFRLNDRYCSVLSAERLPDKVSLGDSFDYIMDCNSAGNGGIRENVLICANIYYEDSKKASKSIDRNRNWANRVAVGPIVKIKPITKKISDSFDLLYDSKEEGDRPCRVAFHVAVFANTADQVIQEAANIESRFAALRYKMKPESQIALPIFFSMLPLNSDPDNTVVSMIGRYKTCTSKHAVRLLPISSEWKGMGRPVATLVGRSGQIIPFNYFDNQTNYNSLTMAESGSGKSVFSNFMVSNILSCGGRAFIIDQGYSYENTSELFGGKFIKFSADSCPNLNPFTFINEFEEEKDMLIGLLVAMTKINPNEAEGRFQVATLRSLLSRVWSKKGRDMLVDDIAAEAGKEGAEKSDKRISDLQVLLEPFTTNGEYGKYYSGEEEAINFDASRVIVMELDDLKNKEHLLQVVVLQLIIQINRYIYSKHSSGDKSWTYMLIDEAWKFMTNGGSENNPILEFLLTAYRQFRKHNASINMVTQSLGDVYAHPAGAAIAENAGIKTFLGQKAEVIERMRNENKLSMPDFWMKQLLSVKTHKGRFSELFIQTSTSQGVARLILSPFNLLLLSTDADDRSDIKRYKSQGYSTVQAVWCVMKERGQRIPKSAELMIQRTPELA